MQSDRHLGGSTLSLFVGCSSDRLRGHNIVVAQGQCRWRRGIVARGGNASRPGWPTCGTALPVAKDTRLSTLLMSRARLSKRREGSRLALARVLFCELLGNARRGGGVERNGGWRPAAHYLEMLRIARNHSGLVSRPREGGRPPHQGRVGLVFQSRGDDSRGRRGLD